MFGLSLDMLRVVEEAAIASARTTGMGDPQAAGQAAVESMRRSLDTIVFEGTIVIGEAERDEAPMLYIGEKVGAKGHNSPVTVDIAVDPLEGTNLGSPAEAHHRVHSRSRHRRRDSGRKIAVRDQADTGARLAGARALHRYHAPGE